MEEEKISFQKHWKLRVTKFCSSFKLTTHKISLISIFLALTTLISLLEIPTFFNDFLTIDFAVTINLLAVFVIGFPYSFLIALIYPWLRFIIPHTVAPSVVGEISTMLASITSLVVFFLIHDLLLFAINGKKDSWKPHLVINIFSAIFACLVISLLNTFYNWAFILDLYGASDQKKILWTLYLPYNIFKFTLILILFICLEKPLAILKHHFNL